MPVKWELVDRMVLVTVVGHGGEGTLKAIIEAIADPQFVPGTSALFDLRQATDNPSSREIAERAKWLASLCEKGLSSRCAIVIAPHQFGRAGISDIHLETQGMQLEIFTNIDKARQWLENGPSE